AATDVPALGTAAQVHPDTADQQAFHATVPTRGDGSDSVELGAGGGHGSSLAENSSGPVVASATPAAPYAGDDHEERERGDGRVRHDLADGTSVGVIPEDGGRAAAGNDDPAHDIVDLRDVGGFPVDRRGPVRV